MTACEILRTLRERGAIVELHEDRFRVDAPKGVLTPEMRSALSARKVEILTLLKSNEAGAERPPAAEPICPQCGGPLQREEAGEWVHYDCRCGRYGSTEPKGWQEQKDSEPAVICSSGPDTSAWTWMRSEGDKLATPEQVCDWLTRTSESVAVLMIVRDKLEIGIHRRHPLADDLLRDLLAHANAVVEFLRAGGLSDNCCRQCGYPLAFEYEQHGYARAVCADCKWMQIW